MLERIRLLLILLAVAPVALPAANGADAATGPVAVYPAAGTPVASAQTQISFRGAAPSALGTITVTGSKSGAHGGRLLAHSDGNGASFLPAKPFTPGEQVSVTVGVPLVGAAGDGAVHFGIAQAPPAHAPKYIPDPGGRARGGLHFHSAPSIFPAGVLVGRHTGTTAPGAVFLGVKAGAGPNGPMIVDDRGGLVWFKRVPDNQSATDVRVQQYENRPVLTWWQGRVFQPGEGFGHGVILDSNYRQIATVNAGNGYRADLHEFKLTPRGTALILAYRPTYWDLRSVGGPRRGVAIDTIVQEVDVKTGLVEFEWHALGNVNVNETYFRQPLFGVLDFIHANSIDEEPDGNLLVCARNTHSLFEVDRATGHILWRLGGRRSTFTLASGTQFIAQHDATRAPDGNITLFDDGAPPVTRRASRGIEIAQDMNAKTARVVHAYVHRPRTKTQSQGSVQDLPNGDVFVGWGGAVPYLSEFTGHGRPIWDARLTVGDSYRAYRFPWSATPATPPSVASARGPGAATSVWASWNGATDVAQWQVLAGPSAQALQPATTVPRKGFETGVRLPSRPAFVAVRALAADGHVLGSSPTIAVK